jgi:hypothetical protein
MFALLILIIFGLGMAYFATQNTGIVHIMAGNYAISGIPIYVLVIGAVLLGIFISWLISMVNSISTSMTLHGKESALKKALVTIEQLKKENRELALENAHLKGQESIHEENHEHDQEEEHEELIHPSLMQRIRNNLA